MLKLKRVELLGFKSFCEKTEMVFNGGGIAAIVGPNGCGKSNLSDAISWVLGEQSAKLLRGTRMEDVIFNGTRERKPLGMAAVSLTLIDPEVFFYGPPPEGAKGGERPGEIVVTRRLFRNGESEYLLNGKLCRLRDIQEIFMGTGLGPESYAIIEQGRIGQILSSRPHDRRAVVEEAAGITKFKTKKRLAEAKLESARQNLARVSDILEEVGRQVNSLKRQAAKARRYDELNKEKIARLAVVLGSRYREMERQAAQAALDLNLAGQEFRDHNERVTALEAEHAAVQKESFDTETQLQQSRDGSAAAAMETERARQRMEYQTRQGEENVARIQEAATEVAVIERRSEELAREFAAERAAAGLLVDQVQTARERLAEKTAALDTLQFRLKEQEGEQERLRQRVLGLLGEASALRNQLAQVEEFLAGLDRQAARAQAEETAAGEEVSHLAGEREKLVVRLDEQQLGLESLDERRRRMESSLAEAQQQAQARRDRMQALKDDIARTEARRQSLEEILSHRAYTTETVKSLFAAIEQGRMGDFQTKGILADFIDVDSSYEKAVEEFLREELEYVVVQSWGAAEQGMRLLRAEMEGHATFLVRPDREPSLETRTLGPETGIAGRLQDHVRLTNGLARSVSALLPRLGRCYLAEDEAAARRLAYQYPELYFLLPDGGCYHGYCLSGGRKASSGPLALKRELRELAPRLATISEQLEAESAALADLARQIASESTELEAVRAELQNQEKSALASEHNLKEIHDRLNRANARLSVARLELERLREESARASEERDHHRAEVEAREAARREAEEALASVRQSIVAGQTQAARVAEEQAELRAQLAALEERRKAALASAARVEQLLAGETGRREEMARQIAAWAAEHDRLTEDNRRLAGELSTLAVRQGELERQGQELDASLHR